jgi:hypothetical protein
MADGVPAAGHVRRAVADVVPALAPEVLFREVIAPCRTVDPRARPATGPTPPG